MAWLCYQLHVALSVFFIKAHFGATCLEKAKYNHIGDFVALSLFCCCYLITANLQISSLNYLHSDCLSLDLCWCVRVYVHVCAALRSGNVTLPVFLTTLQ